MSHKENALVQTSWIPHPSFYCKSNSKVELFALKAVIHTLKLQRQKYSDQALEIMKGSGLF